MHFSFDSFRCFLDIRERNRVLVGMSVGVVHRLLVVVLPVPESSDGNHDAFNRKRIELSYKGLKCVQLDDGERRYLSRADNEHADRFLQNLQNKVEQDAP